MLEICLTSVSSLQTENMLKDYVTKIQDLEAELHHFKSSRTGPPASSRPLSSTALDLAQSIAATDFGTITDILPSGKFTTIRYPLSNVYRFCLCSIDCGSKHSYVTHCLSMNRFCRRGVWCSRGRSSGKGVGAYHAPRKP